MASVSTQRRRAARCVVPSAADGSQRFITTGSDCCTTTIRLCEVDSANFNLRVCTPFDGVTREPASDRLIINPQWRCCWWTPPSQENAVGGMHARISISGGFEPRGFLCWVGSLFPLERLSVYLISERHTHTRNSVAQVERTRNTLNMKRMNLAVRAAGAAWCAIAQEMSPRSSSRSPSLCNLSTSHFLAETRTGRQVCCC